MCNRSCGKQFMPNLYHQTTQTKDVCWHLVQVFAPLSTFGAAVAGEVSGPTDLPRLL